MVQKLFHFVSKSQRRVIAVGYWLSTFSEGATRILIPLYFHSLGIATTKIAVMFVFYEVFGLLTNMLSGFFINKYGYKKAYLLSLFLHTLASLGYLAMFVGPYILTVFLVNMLRSLRGIAKELIKTTSSAYLRHLAKTHLDTHLLLGLKDTVKGFGIICGGVMLSFLTFKVSFFLLGILTLFCLVFSLFMIEDYREVRQVKYSGFFKVSNNMLYLSLIRLFLYAGRDIWLVIAVPIYMASLGINSIKIGFVLAAGLIVFGLVQPLTGFFVKSIIRVGEYEIKGKWFYEDIISVASFFLLLVPIGMIYFKENIISILILIIFYNFFAGLATAPHNYLHIRFSDKERASVDISFYKTVSQLGKVLAVFVSGILYDFYGLNGCLFGSLLCLFTSGVLGSILANRVHRQKLRKKLELGS